MDHLRDIRLTLRHLLRQPGYALAVVITLALAIGASSGIFSAVYAVLLKPLPIDDAESLVVSWGADSVRDRAVVELSYRNFQDWRAGSRSFTDAAAMGSSNWTMVMDGQGDPARVPYTAVTASFFDTLGVRPLLGRGFRSGDDVPNAPGTIVLNHGAWVRRFGGDPGVVGTAIRLDEKVYTVVGVMPGGFDFPRNAEFWTPVVPILAASSEQWGGDALTEVGVLFVIGRLGDGVTPAAASQELDRLARRVETAGTPRFGTRVIVTPFLDYLLGPVRTALWLLFAAVGVLLVIACANVSALMLTRVSLRRREHAIRLALGGSRLSLSRLWLVEIGVLSLAGGVLGLISARWIAALIVRLGPDDIPRLGEASINLPVAAFTCGTILLTALLCGIGPVRHAGAPHPFAALKNTAAGREGRGPRRARSLLLVFQIGLAIVLLISAGLIARSFMQLRGLDLGFTPSGVVTMHVDPRQAGASANDWFAEALTRIEGLPGVVAAGAIYLPPLALGPIGQETRILLEGQPDTPAASRTNPALNYQVATPGYFSAMRIALRRGRLFEPRDDRRAPRVAIVGENAAQRLWPGEDPIGKRLAMPTFTPDESGNTWRTVIGVVSDVRYRSVDDDASLDVYDPSLQASLTADHLVIRTEGDPLAIRGAVQAAARVLSPRSVINGLTTMDAVVARAVAPWHLSAWMFALFALLAAFLAAVGLSSVVSLDVASRRHEFAVRLALGAVRRDILRVVFTNVGRQIAAGVGLGLAVALIGTRALQTLLFGVELLDGATYAAVMALVLTMVTVASYVPARRAAAIDPATLLRGD
jgi:putative ABC transport system permease protein